MNWKPLAALGFAAAAPCVSAAWAGAAGRAWVSGHGTDAAGCGAPATPCRSLQYAHDHIVAAGGEIDILDPAGYGAITITKSISIVNDGVGTAGVQASGRNAIDIDASVGDSIYLKGLNIDGLEGTGNNGISFSSGTNLTILDCVVRHFGSSGILLSVSSGFPRVLVADTIVSDNTNYGVHYAGSGTTAATQLVIVRVLANNNSQSGVYAETFPGGNFLQLSLNGSVLTNNSLDGLDVVGNIVASADSSVMEANGGDGALVASGILHLSRSMLIQNGWGVENSNSFPGQVFSTGDNRMFGNNHAATIGAAPVLEAPQ